MISSIWMLCREVARISIWMESRNRPGEKMCPIVDTKAAQKCQNDARLYQIIACNRHGAGGDNRPLSETAIAATSKLMSVSVPLASSYVEIPTLHVQAKHHPSLISYRSSQNELGIPPVVSVSIQSCTCSNYQPSSASLLGWHRVARVV